MVKVRPKLEMVEVTHAAISKERGEKVIVQVTAAQAKHMAASGWKLVTNKKKEEESTDGES